MTGIEPTNQPTEDDDASPVGPEQVPRRTRAGMAMVAAVAVLAIAGAVLTALYVHANHQLGQARSAVSVNAAQGDEARAQNSDLQTRLKALQDTQIDLAGLDAIKACVQINADQEKVLREFFDAIDRGEVPQGGQIVSIRGGTMTLGWSAPGPDGLVVAAKDVDDKNPWPCTDAATHLT